MSGADDPGRTGGAHEHGHQILGTPRQGETTAERETRQIAELLQETRVAAVGVQVIVGFLLAVPFSTDLAGLQQWSYVIAIMFALLATGLLLAPGILHRALLHRGQAEWLVAIGSRLLLWGAAATSVALVSSALLVGDRVLDGWVRFLPAAWTAFWLVGLWLVVPAVRRRRVVRPVWPASPGAPSPPERPDAPR